MLHILAQHEVEMTCSGDQEVIEAFPAQGANEAFRDRVRPGCSDRRPNDPHVSAAEDSVEAATPWPRPTSSPCVSTRLLDLHRVPHPKLALLDLRRLLTRSVAQHERVAHANRFAVNFERAPAGLVLDPVIVANRQQLFTHLVALS